MTVDEIVDDVRQALGLSDRQVLVNVIVMGEYVDLDPGAEQPERRRLSVQVSDELEPWTAIGMLQFCQMRENDAVRNAWEDDED